MKNHTENDEDFIEYEIDPLTKLTMVNEGLNKYEFAKVLSLIHM